MKRFITKLQNYISYRYALTSKERYINYLKKKGIKIGKDLWVTNDLKSLTIDTTRPSLIEIGNNVRLNKNLTILTHDGSFYVLRNKYHEFIATSGRVKIGNNVYFGRNCTVFKNVTIGDNCIIGFGSIVTKDIPSNCIAVGAPAKVVSNLNEYFEKRKQQSIEESLDYARSIKERFGRAPIAEDFWEEFPLFVDASNINLYSNLPIKDQLGPSFENWLMSHKAPFSCFEEFLAAAKIENYEINKSEF